MNILNICKLSVFSCVAFNKTAFVYINRLWVLPWCTTLWPPCVSKNQLAVVKQAEHRHSLQINIIINQNKTWHSRRSRLRYRRKRKEKNEALKQVNPIVVNKSSIDLSNGVKELLAKGLNFVPTPK